MYKTNSYYIFFVRLSFFFFFFKYTVNPEVGNSFPKGFVPFEQNPEFTLL